MQFESRWEKQQRLKRQKRSSVAGMITAVILVLLLGVAMWNGKRTLEKKNRIYEEQSESLTQQINEQQQRQMHDQCAPPAKHHFGRADQQRHHHTKHNDDRQPQCRQHR